jgi:hypothetical protein
MTEYACARFCRPTSRALSSTLFFSKRMLSRSVGQAYSLEIEDPDRVPREQLMFQLLIHPGGEFGDEVG